MKIEDLIAHHEEKMKRYRAEGFTTEFTEETLAILARVQIQRRLQNMSIRTINHCDGCDKP